MMMSPWAKFSYLCDAVHHRVAQRDNGVHAAKRYPAHQIRKKFHVLCPLSIMLRPCTYRQNRKPFAAVIYRLCKDRGLSAGRPAALSCGCVGPPRPRRALRPHRKPRPRQAIHSAAASSPSAAAALAETYTPPFDDDGRGQLADLAVGVPRHAGAGQAVKAMVGNTPVSASHSSSADMSGVQPALQARP